MLTAIRQWVIKTMLKSKGQTGVVQTLPKKELIEINTQITAQRLLQNGIDPNALRTSDQVENAVIAIETKEKANLAENIRGGIGSTKSAKVFDLQGKEIKNTKNIMGGEELPPPGSRGGPDDIAAPFASREETMTNMVKDELMKTDNPFSDLVKTTEKGPKSLKQREKEILESMEKNNKEAVERIRERKRLEDADDQESSYDDGPADFDPDADDPNYATGGRVGLMAGKFVKLAQLLKNPKKVQQAIDNIFPTGDYKIDAEMAAESLVELNPKFFGNKLYDDLDSMTRLDIYDAVISPMMANQAKALRMKRASKPTKTLQGIEKTGKINISDPEVASEFEKFMKQTDPEGFKKLEQQLELDNFDPKGRKKNATGGRAGFKAGLGKRFLELLKGKPKPKFDVERFREGPIDLKFLENIDKKDLAPFIRSRDTMGPGGYGMYDNFADMPAGLRAAELIKTIKGPRNEINYKAAELFLGKKLRGDETVDELLQVLNRQEMRADGGRIGLKAGMTKRAFLKLMGGVGATIGAAKSGLLGIGKGAGKQVTKEVVEQGVRSTPPPYFFELVDKIKTLGKPDKVTYADRVEIHRYRGKNGDEYELIEDLSTGDMKITKDKTVGVTSGDKSYDGIGDRSVMEYKKGDADVDIETQRGYRSADEYDEYEVKFDYDGTEADADDMSEIIRKEIIEEATGDAPSIKKAGGGIARMLGE